MPHQTNLIKGLTEAFTTIISVGISITIITAFFS